MNDHLFAPWGNRALKVLESALNNRRCCCNRSNLYLLVYPVFGWLTGIVLFLCSVMIRWLFNAYASGLFFALLACAVLSFGNFAAGDQQLAYWILSRFKRLNRDILLVRSCHCLLIIVKFIILLLIGTLAPGQIVLITFGCAALFIYLRKENLLRSEPEARTYFMTVMAIMLFITLFIARRQVIFGVLLIAALWHPLLSRIAIAGNRSKSAIFAISVIQWLLLLVALLAL